MELAIIGGGAAGMMAALDAIFSRRSDKQHILSVIAKNRWE